MAIKLGKCNYYIYLYVSKFQKYLKYVTFELLKYLPNSYVITMQINIFKI